MADFKELLKAIVDKYPEASNRDIQRMLDPNANSYSHNGIGDFKRAISPEDALEFEKLMMKQDMSKMDLSDPKSAQRAFDIWKSKQAEMRDMQNKLPMSGDFADQMSDSLIRQKPSNSYKKMMDTVSAQGDGALELLKDAGYNMERKRGYMEKMANGVPFEKLMKMVKPGAKSLLSALPIAATGLAAAGIGSDAMAGEFGKAAMGAADLGTDFVPVVGQIKDALQSEALGSGEDQALKQLRQSQQSQESNDPEARRFAKMRQLMGK